MLIQKAFSPSSQMGKPSQPELDAINRLFALEPVGEDDVRVLTMHVATDQVDRSYERFSVPVLQRFAETIVGKPVLTGHDKSQVPRGRFFSGDVVKQSDGSHHLVARAYLDATDPLVGQVARGIAKDVSIGATVDQRICDLCGDGSDYDRVTKSGKQCDHRVGQKYGENTCTLTWGGDLNKYEVRETSFVYLACQPGAQVVAANAPSGYLTKAAVPGGSQIIEYGAVDVPAPEGEDMELQEALEKIAALEEENGRLKPLAEEGERARKSAIAEVQRKYGSLKLEKTGESICKSLAAATLEAIGEADKEAQALYDEKFPPQSMGSARDLTKDETIAPARRFDPLGLSPFRRSA